MSERAVVRRLRYIARSVLGIAPRISSVVVLLVIVTSLSGAVLSLASKWVVDSGINGSWSTALVIAIGAAIALGMLDIGVLALHHLQQMLSSRVNHEFDRETLAITANMPGIQHLEGPAYLDRVRLVQGRGEELTAVTWSVLDSAGLLVRLVVAVAMLSTVDPLLALLPACALPAALLTGASQARVQHAVERAASTRRIADQLHTLFIDPRPAKELRLFACGRNLDRRCREMSNEVGDVRLRAELASSALGALGWLIFGIGFAAALAITANQSLRGHGTLGDFALVTQLTLQVRGNVSGTVATIHGLHGALHTIDRLMWLYEYAAGIAPKDNDSAPVPRSNQEGLVLNDVSFGYPGTEGNILTKFSLRVPAGSTLAVVGENGAGKSTLVKLLCRLYEPTEGRITVDGVDISRFAVTDWRTRIAAGFQDFLCLETKVREIVGVGWLPLIDDDEAIKCALARAEATELSASWDSALDTLIGKAYHDGVELSGGQWQKLAVARALMRPAPLLLILDEPTAALDPASEHALFERHATTSRLARETGCITVLISHRFSTVRMADHIVVMHNGAVTEQGAHHDLLARGGRYAELFNLQASAYR